MKKLLPVILLLVTISAGAQIVNIPDANLKNALVTSAPTAPPYLIARNSNGSYIAIDANSDGEIQVSEALQVWNLNLHDQNISSIVGLEAFTNLRVLWIRENPIVHIDATVFPNLEEFSCGNSENLTSFNVAGMSTLKILRCSHNPSLNTIDLQGLINLESLTCLNTNINAINLDGLTNLKVLDCSENNISSIDLSDLVNLEYLDLHETNITTLSLVNCPDIETLNCRTTGLVTVDISMLQDLVEALFGGSDNLEIITVGSLPNLQNLDCRWTKISEIDLSGCPSFEYLDCASTNELRFVNLKNGPQFASLDTYSNDYDRFLCTDENEINLLPEYILNGNININSYCSFTPGGDYNTITGNFQYTNGDCGDAVPVHTAISVQINDGTQTGVSFNSSGSYSFFTGAGNFIITPQFENNWFISTPASAEITFADNNNNMVTQNFCIVPNGTHPDVEVVIVPYIWANPGFDASYKIIFKNKGNQTLSGDVTFNYDDAVFDYVSATPAVASSSAGNLTWSYTGLIPFETRELYVVLNLNSPMETPPVVDGDELSFSASITPSTGDETPNDNTFTLTQTVSGSYDPNDITCLEGDVVAPEKIGEYLHYNINFENTGSAPATFIVVKDIINEEQFDVSTLQLMYASHDVDVRVQDNKIEFYFDDIQLGPLEKGNVVFKIKTLSTLQVNDDVTQQAEIFFDYNWPIVTNEATTVFQTLSTGDFAVDNSVKIYPNPTEDIVNVASDSNITSVQVYDVQGRLLQAMSPDDVTAILDITARVEGMYFVKIMTEAGIKVEKIVKK